MTLSYRKLTALTVAALCGAGCASKPKHLYALPATVITRAFDTLVVEARAATLRRRACVAATRSVIRQGQFAGEVNVDPPPAILARLADSAVAPYSKCAVRQQPPHWGALVDSVTGERVVVVTIGDSVSWHADTVMLDGGWVCGGLCAAAGTLRLWRDGAHLRARFDVYMVSRAVRPNTRLKLAELPGGLPGGASHGSQKKR